MAISIVSSGETRQLKSDFVRHRRQHVPGRESTRRSGSSATSDLRDQANDPVSPSSVLFDRMARVHVDLSSNNLRARGLARLRLLALLVVVVIASGCESGETESAPSPQVIDPWQRDSAAYEGALAMWLRDSAVVDSVSRTINTDSLYRLYRLMLHHPNPGAVMPEIACEGWRIRRRYRALPAIEAERRMKDTVWLPDEADAVRQMNERLAGVGEVTTGPWACGGDVDRLVPDVVGGAPMSMSTMRPVPPRRPQR
jgi:hypothetical protein